MKPPLRPHMPIEAFIRTLAPLAQLKNGLVDYDG